MDGVGAFVPLRSKILRERISTPEVFFNAYDELLPAASLTRVSQSGIRHPACQSTEPLSPADRSFVSAMFSLFQPTLLFQAARGRSYWQAGCLPSLSKPSIQLREQRTIAHVRNYANGVLGPS